MAAAAPVRTTCPYCGVGCGVVATPDGQGGAEVSGDPAHPANFGKLCVKGSALGETLGLEGRLLHPMIHGQRATWSQAVGFVADGMRRILDRDGPGAIAFYLSGQLLTEDYYLANKFAKASSARAMSTQTAAMHGVLGGGTPARLRLRHRSQYLRGPGRSRPHHPRRIERGVVPSGAFPAHAGGAGQPRRVVVNIDPRRTATSEGADLQLSLKPGSDSALFAWLLVQIDERGATDRAYVSTHVSGAELAVAAARRIAPDLATVAEKTGLEGADIARFVELFIARERVVTCYSQGVNQSAQGSDKVNAILNCHLATGRIGKPGCGPLSLTGQPNAMGGREVGGLANMLAAHMNYSAPEVERVRRFWDAPNMATAEGFKAVQMFEAIERGEIKALWVMHTNPAVSLPRADAMREAMRKLELFVVSEALAETDTTAAGAHVLLPATAWGEKDGTVTNSERRISRQRAFLPAPGEAKPDWEHVALVARRMKFAGFDHRDAAGIFREHAALSALDNDGARDFDIGALAGIEAGRSTRWSRSSGRGGPARCRRRGSSRRGFYTPDGRGRMLPVAEPRLASPADGDRPFILNTGRVRDHWHTMTRTGKSVKLARHVAEPTIAVHPLDAGARRRGGRLPARGVGAWRGDAEMRAGCRAGARVRLRALPLERRHERALAGGRRRAAQDGSCLGPAGAQGDARLSHAVAMACEGVLLARHRVSLPKWLQHTRITVPGARRCSSPRRARR